MDRIEVALNQDLQQQRCIDQELPSKQVHRKQTNSQPTRVTSEKNADANRRDSLSKTTPINQSLGEGVTSFDCRVPSTHSERGLHAPVCLQQCRHMTAVQTELCC